MKFIAIILSLVIFASSLDAVNFVSSMSMVSFSQDIEASPLKGKCCKAKILIATQENESCSSAESLIEHEKMSCCDGEGCKCKCCGHVVYVHPAMIDLQFVSRSFFELIPFSFSYFHDFKSTVIIPPNKSWS